MKYKLCFYNQEPVYSSLLAKKHKLWIKWIGKVKDHIVIPKNIDNDSLK